MRRFTVEINSLPSDPRFANKTVGRSYIIHLDIINPTNRYYRHLKGGALEEYFQILEEHQNLEPQYAFGIVRFRCPNSIYNPVLFSSKPGAMSRHKTTSLTKSSTWKICIQCQKLMGWSLGSSICQLETLLMPSRIVLFPSSWWIPFFELREYSSFHYSSRKWYYQ